jgi:hypothetical protein
LKFRPDIKQQLLQLPPEPGTGLRYIQSLLEYKSSKNERDFQILRNIILKTLKIRRMSYFRTKVGIHTQIGVINQRDNSELKISEAK